MSAKNGMNLYRGCQHGCIYCDSRSACYHMEHDFEDVEVKENALELLEDALKKKRRRCMLGMGSMTDPYIPLEEKLRHTRKALELAEQYGFGITLITKSARVLRDLELFRRINTNSKCVIQMTLTTSDEKLCRVLEPNVSTTAQRVQALETLRDAGIPTVVWLCPFLPFINDTEENINALVDDCIQAKVHGVIFFGVGLTLREGNREYFYRQLDCSFPGMKERYIRSFGDAYNIVSPRDRELSALVRRRCAEAGIVCDNDEVFRYLGELDCGSVQLSMF